MFWENYSFAFINKNFSSQILNEIAQHKIKIYEFPEVEEEEDSKLHKVLRDRVPFAVVGANTVVEHENGKKVRGRKYPWGVAEGISFFQLWENFSLTKFFKYLFFYLNIFHFKLKLFFSIEQFVISV